MKLTQKEIKHLIVEEKKDTQLYYSLHLPTIARDEARHRRILMAKLKPK